MRRQGLNNSKNQSFLREKSGSIATLTAVLTPFLLAVMGLATDAGTWYTDKTELRFHADGSALSAAYLHNRGLDPTQIEAIVKNELVAQGLPSSSLALSIVYPTAADDHLTLTASYDSKKYLSQLVFPGTVSVSASTKVKTQNYEACVLALNETVSGAFSMTGSATANLSGCVTASNSKHVNSISLGGSSSLVADCMIASGGISGVARATTGCNTNGSYQRKTDDPFANLSQPSHVTSSCKNAGNFKPNNNYTLTPGCFKGSMSLKGNVTFPAGVYVLDGVDLGINSNAVVTGTDVTFVLKNGATLDFNGGATINLKAPETGSAEPYPGMLFWGDGSGSVAHNLSGNSSSAFQGAMYFPSDSLTFTGNSGMDVGCIRLAADTIAFQGNADLQSNCASKLGGHELQAAGAVVIVL